MKKKRPKKMESITINPEHVVAIRSTYDYKTLDEVKAVVTLTNGERVEIEVELSEHLRKAIYCTVVPAPPGWFAVWYDEIGNIDSHTQPILAWSVDRTTGDCTPCLYLSYIGCQPDGIRGPDGIAIMDPVAAKRRVTEIIEAQREDKK